MVSSSMPASADTSTAKLADILVQHFAESYFRDNLPSNTASSAYPIVRWRDEISIDVVNPQLLPEDVNAYATDLVAALRVSGFDIKLSASESDAANVSVILFDAADGFSQTDLALLKRHMSGNRDALQYFVKRLGERPTCSMGGMFGDPYHLRSAFAVVNANLPGESIWHCLGRMITGIVGFQGNVEDGIVRRSIFSSSTSSAHVSDWDLLVFQMLADDRLKAGMLNNESTQILLRQIAGELISAWPRRDELEESLQAY